MGPARAARHRPYSACPLLHTGAASSPTSGMSMVLPVAGDSQCRPTRPAHGYPREQALLGPRHQASPPRQTRTAEGCAGRRSAQGRGRVVEAARSTPAARPLPFPQEPTPGARSEREPASEAGGRVGVGPGLLRRPPSSESHGGAHSSSRLAPTTPTHSSSDEPLPLVSAGPRPTTPPGTVVPPGSLVVVGGLVGCRGVAGEIALELVQLLQHCLEVAEPAAINQRTLAPVSLSASLSWTRV
jgi:hypothetical protein